MTELKTVTSPLVLKRRDLRAGDSARSHMCSSGVSGNLFVCAFLACFPLAAISLAELRGGAGAYTSGICAKVSSCWSIWAFGVLLKGTSHCSEGVLAPLPATRHLSGFGTLNQEPSTS